MNATGKNFLKDYLEKLPNYGKKMREGRINSRSNASYMKDVTYHKRYNNNVSLVTKLHT